MSVYIFLAQPKDDLTGDDRLYAAICRQALDDAQGKDPFLAEEAEAFLFRELPSVRPLLQKVIYGDARTGTN